MDESKSPANGTTPIHTGEFAATISFLNALFESGDTITFRPVETWTADGRKHQRIDFQGIAYLHLTDTLTTSPRARALCNSLVTRAAQERTNTFFGVCPRFGGGGQFEKAWQIRTVRALWADVDDASVDDVFHRIATAGLPRPSMLVNSGNGVHVYWLLSEPYLIDDAGEPPPVESAWVEIHGKKKRLEYFTDAEGDQVELHDRKTGKPLQRNHPQLTAKAVRVQDVLQGIAAAIGGDHTFDLARLLRVPGTLNRKNQRSGDPPRACELVENNGKRFSFDEFERFAESSRGRETREKVKTIPLPARKRMTGKRRDKLSTLVWACGNAAVGDRSETDYYLCCWCIEHGLTAQEIWPQVQEVGKFAERGEVYFQRTWDKAAGAVRLKIMHQTERCIGSMEMTARTVEQVDGDPERVPIELTTREFDINNQVIDVLAADEGLYQRGGQLVTVLYGSIEKDAIQRPDNAPRIAALPTPIVRELISKHVDFYEAVKTENGPKDIPKHVPDWCVRAVHARGEWPKIRLLSGIVNHPVLKPDGSILTQPGFDPQTGLILHWAGEPLNVPQEPTQQEAIDAVGRLKSLVSDFPFETAAHRAGWLAFLLTVLIRHAFGYAITAPLFLIDASVRGSGKTLLADMIGMIICGFPLPRMILPKTDEEMRKHMLSLVIAADEFALFDNVVEDLGGPTLDAVLTGTQFKDRVLGESRDVSLPIVTTFAATVNNASITGDICRRTIHVRLASPLEKPEERNDFEIPNILQHVRKHRSELLIDALTILRAYVVAGRPDQDLTAMGSFEEWSQLARAPLVWCGEPDPWETRHEFAGRADTALHTLGEVLRRWQEVDPDDRGLTVAELTRQLEANPQTHSELRAALWDLCDCKPNETPSTKLIGKRLSSFRDRVYQGRKLVGKPNRINVTVWRVEQSQTRVQGLQTVAGLFSATSRGEKSNKGGREEEKHALLHPPHSGGAGETPHKPANPAGVESSVA